MVKGQLTCFPLDAAQCLVFLVLNLLEQQNV
jgi:hypothetical protein